MRILTVILFGLTCTLSTIAQIPCLGPAHGLPGIGQKTTPPASSGTFDETYTGTFTVPRTGVYEITGTVAIGKGAGAPVDFTRITASVAGVTVIDELPPPIAGTPTPPNGWTYYWSIYYYTLSKPYQLRAYFETGKSYTLALRGQGSYQVFTPYHRRNYGMSLSGTATYCGPLATATSIGTGCVGTAAPTLSAPMTPVIGTSRDLLLTGRANAFGGVIFGLETSTPRYLGAGCNVYVDLNGPTPILSLSTGATGSGYALFKIPANPALMGQRIATQGILIDPSSPLGFALSNGMILTLGF